MPTNYHWFTERAIARCLDTARPEPTVEVCGTEISRIAAADHWRSAETAALRELIRVESKDVILDSCAPDDRRTDWLPEVAHEYSEQGGSGVLGFVRLDDSVLVCTSTHGTRPFPDFADSNTASFPTNSGTTRQI